MSAHARSEWQAELERMMEMKRTRTPEVCDRTLDCARESRHADLCRRADGTVILVRRAPLADEQIAAARAPTTGIERAMEELDLDAPRPDTHTLTGPAHEAFRVFADVCARMEAHNKASAETASALNKEYIAALERFSAIAAKAGAR